MSSSSPLLRAYTDGSTYRANPGPMGWSVVYVEHMTIIDEKTGALYTGTNNKAELMAVIWALEYQNRLDLAVYSDSILTINIATGKWRARHNVDLWERFETSLSLRESRGLTTLFQYVKSHSIDPFNRRADLLARTAAVNAAEWRIEQEPP